MAFEHDRTVTHVFLESRAKPASQVAFRYNDAGKWLDISWPEYFKTSERVAAGLASLGVKRGDRVAVLSNTRHQWAISDMAILGMGAITVPIYQSSTSEDACFILNNSNAVAIFVEDASQLAKVKSFKNQVPSLKDVICFTDVTDKDVLSWIELVGRGTDYLEKNSSFYVDECDRNKLSDMATIVYTSGTTGQPKGVVLLHSCIASECEELQKLLNLSDKDSTLTWLPFAHIFGRVELWANIYIGWKMCFAESVDRIANNLAEIKPTFMMAVPRIFEKIYARINSQVDEGSPLKKKLFLWAVGVGKQVSQHKREKHELPMALGLQYQLAYKLVFSKINDRLGGRIRFLVSGGAPLAKEIAEFFHAAGVLVLEGYGLTETTAAVTVNTPYNYKFGSVGQSFGDVQLKIAEDGEILVKSAKVFREYFQNKEATAEALDDGWFRTGDIGDIDGNGFLRITDRKKDLIKTAGGKMIAPQKLENMLKTNKFISQAVIFGDKMKYLVALVTLNSDEAKKFAETQSIHFSSVEDLAADARVNELVREIIREKNAHLASYETIKNFAILPSDLTVESGELTPSLKVKRKLVGEKYDAVIRNLYT